MLHVFGIKVSIYLGSRAVDCGSFGLIKNFELYSTDVSYSAYQASHRIDLSYQCASSNSSNGGIARHLTYGVLFLRH